MTTDLPCDPQDHSHNCTQCADPLAVPLRWNAVCSERCFQAWIASYRLGGFVVEQPAGHAWAQAREPLPATQQAIATITCIPRLSRPVHAALLCDHCPHPPNG